MSPSSSCEAAAVNERKPIYRRAWFLLAIAAVLVITLLRVLVWANGPDGAYTLDARRFMQSRELFERAAAELLASGETEIELPGVKDIRVWGEGGEAVVEFTTGGFGLAPSSSYHGVYYSADGEPAALPEHRYAPRPPAVRAGSGTAGATTTAKPGT